MKYLLPPAVIALMLAFVTAHAGGPSAKTASVTLVNASGQLVGQAKFTQGPRGVLINLKVKNLNPGRHGLHLFTHTPCDVPSGLTLANWSGGPFEGGHGSMPQKGAEAGDIPNILVGADGTGEIEVYTESVSLRRASKDRLDANGSAFIIREKSDDYRLRLLGGTRARVACGVIKND